jgi:ComF family protein
LNVLVNSFLDFILPRFCYNCGEKLTPADKLFCSKCVPLINRASPERLQREFNRKFAANNIISGFQSLYVFEEEGAIQKIIHEMKYKNSFLLGKSLGRLVAQELSNKIIQWSADIIIPVPIHILRKAERGYNQSLFLAKGISSVLNIPVKTNIVKRAKYTSTQTKLNLTERKENVKDAFICKHPDVFKGKRIILLDDVITTGATITECGKVLLDNGTEKVYAMSAAIAD